MRTQPGDWVIVVFPAWHEGQRARVERPYIGEGVWDWVVQLETTGQHLAVKQDEIRPERRVAP